MTAGKLSYSWRDVALFALCSVGCMAVVFGSALWNGSILAPLDIPAALYSKFHWLDETQGPVPDNHYTVDIFDHELPRQFSIHRAIQAGEFPWWDPYTDCGRPLAADAHISGTDVLRLALYRFQPFVPAYNLTKLLHSLLLGLGAFLLLRHWSHPFWLSLIAALAFQFAGPFALFQTPLCVPASAAWYPWIWLAWSSYLRGRRISWLGAGGLFCAMSIAAGNQQTHAFLAVFGACFLAGNVWHNRSSWKPALCVSGFSLVAGALVALPVLWPQIELYLLCNRKPAMADFSAIKLLTGAASLSGVFPWALGTFRTIDASKVFGETGLGFSLFIGSAVLVLSAVGAARSFQRSRRTAQGPTAILLVAAYFIICSTPLVAIFYTRLAALAVLGLVTLAVEGASDILGGNISPWQKRLAKFGIIGVFGVFLCCNVFAFLVYPRVQDRVEAFMVERDKANRSLDTSPELRRFQVRNLPREISVLNLETVGSVVSLGALLAAVCAASAAARGRWLALALVLNLVPELSFAERFTSRSPSSQWEKLLTGGPEQRRVINALQNGSRLGEESPGRFEGLFPGAVAHFYRVHAAGGYSSFPFTELSVLWKQRFPQAPWQDATYSSVERGLAAGQLEIPAPRTTPARFQWVKPSERSVRIVSETLNTITVEVDDGETGVLWRTDRYYPGWKLASKHQTAIEGGNFLIVDVPAGRQTLEFRYQPRWLATCLVVGSAALLLCAVLLAVGRRSVPPGH